MVSQKAQALQFQFAAPLSRQISCIIACRANTRNRVLDDAQLRALALVEAFVVLFERMALSLALKPSRKQKCADGRSRFAVKLLT